jgi:transcriptional regulator with XRE-family HTH domain
LKKEQSFGASLRRLRIQRGLKREDFSPLTAKTLARIERGEVQKPRGKWLLVIAEKLQVDPDQIENY